MLQFNKMNTPNKFFEYLLVGVKLIVLKNTLLDVEDAINFGAVSSIRCSILSKLKG